MVLTPGTPGDLFVSGESIALGYWRRADANRTVFQGEWLRTGDTYIVDDEGYYHCLGRSNDLLKAGGIWVAPAEVEERLLEHDGVAEAAVVGMPDGDGIDKPAALIVRSPGHDDVCADDLIGWCRDGLAAFKRPRTVEFATELPKTATGKIQRFPRPGDDARTDQIGSAAMTVHSVDLLIVGAGPVGLYGAYYAGVRGLRVAVIDSLSQLGGQITAMYPEKLIFDIAGYPAVKGRDLVDALVEQAASASPLYLLGQEAQELSTDSSGTHVVKTSGGDEIRCGAIVITAGIGTFTPRKLPAGEDFLGRGLEYFVPDPAPYAGADVVIVGGGDSALDWALMLEDIASSVRSCTGEMHSGRTLPRLRKSNGPRRVDHRR